MNIRSAVTKYVRIMILAVVIVAAAGSFAFSEAGFTGSGSGTETDPYIISDLSELEEVSQLVAEGHSFEGEYLRLESDIDLPEGWKPIGALKEGETSSGNGKNINPFSGTFDGGYHTVTSAEGGYSLFGYVRKASIRNFTIAGQNIAGNGLIRNYTVDYGPTGSGTGVKTAVIENVIIRSGTRIHGSGFIGGSASSGNTVDIVNCVAEEGVTVGFDPDDNVPDVLRDRVGSFGGAFNGTVTLCKSAATVYGGNYVGGIIGCQGQSMSNVVISGCTFSGKVKASGSYVGGIAGGSYGGAINTAPNASAISIDNCCCSGDIEAKDTAGGILGYETTVQAWDNTGERYIRNNLFTGSISIAEGTACGGIVGAFRGLDRNNVVKSNFYSEDCGAVRGIGKVTYVDTSCETHETEIGENYFYGLSQETIPIYEGLNDEFPENLKPGYYRDDDPLGADAFTLSRPVNAEELADGSLVQILNDADWSNGCWRQGESGPYISVELAPVGISVADGYKKEYYIGEELDKESLIFNVKWSDGSAEEINGNAEGLTITGFDSSEKAFLTLTARYGSVVTSFEIRILSSNTDPVLVTFTLMGDESHSLGEETIVHTRSRGNLQEWFNKKYLMSENDTVFELIVKALEEKGLSYTGSRIYISGIQIPGTDDYLMEKANGPNSGWMYSVNGKEPGIGVGEYFLSDGADVQLFYSDDFTLESSTFSPEETADRLKAEDAADLIKVLPSAAEVKLSDKTEAEHARDEYDKLTDVQKGYISSYLKDKLESVLSRIAELEKEVYKGRTYKVDGNSYKVTLKASASKSGKVTAVKMKKKTVPAYVKLSDGRKYYVTAIGKSAFSGTKIKTVYLKTKKLSKTAVKGCLKGSVVKTIKISLGKKSLNRRYRIRYKKIFTKKNAGRKVTVR